MPLVATSKATDKPDRWLHRLPSETVFYESSDRSLRETPRITI